MSPRRQAIRLLVLLTAGYVFYAGFAWARQTDILFPGRTRPPEGLMEPLPDGVERLGHDAEARRALLIRSRTPGAPLVVFAHGNGEIMEDWFADLRELATDGIHVLMVEYPGYAGLPGTPSQESIHPAFVEMIDAAEQRLAPEKPRRIGFGYSIGAAVVADVGRERPFDALLLHAPFSSVGSMALRRGLPPALVRSRFDTVSALRGFAGPVVVVHGLADSMIPPDEGREVAAAAPHGTFIGLEGVNHDAGFGDWDAARARLVELARAISRPRP